MDDPTIVGEVVSSAALPAGALLSVLIIEDHEIVRSAVRAMLLDLSPSGGVGLFEAATLGEAEKIIQDAKTGFDLILLDVNLPDASGLRELEYLRGEWAGLPVVVLSASEDWELAAEFLRAGALGFIPKSSNVSIIANALRLILAGDRYFPSPVFELLAGGGAKTKGGELTRKASGDAELSPRQKEVLRLMRQGQSNKEIARNLGISVGTVKNYVAAILRAHHATSRAKAVLAAGDAAGF